MRASLGGISMTATGVRLAFETANGRLEREHEKVVLALPFTKLRQVAGVDALGLAAEQLRAIRELCYGDNSKLMVSTTGRPWLDAGRLRAAPSGVFFSDQFQCVWETSRAQQGSRGILTNFLTGAHDREAAFAAMRQGLSAFAPAIADSLDTTRLAWMDWSRQPFALGSYAGPKVGQFTTLLEQTAPPSPDGRIHFAGEHTSVDFMGFMNGAVESGERVAQEILA
jgi:monoamine oxidase